MPVTDLPVALTCFAGYVVQLVANIWLMPGPEMFNPGAAHSAITSGPPRTTANGEAARSLGMRRCAPRFPPTTATCPPRSCDEIPRPLVLPHVPDQRAQHALLWRERGGMRGAERRARHRAHGPLPPLLLPRRLHHHRILRARPHKPDQRTYQVIAAAAGVAMDLGELARRARLIASHRHPVRLLYTVCASFPHGARPFHALRVRPSPPLQDAAAVVVRR